MAKAARLFKVCVDQPTSAEQLLELGMIDYGAVDNRTVWTPKGTTLRIRFLEGDAVVQAKVVEYAQQWVQFANIHFHFLINDRRLLARLQRAAWAQNPRLKLSLDDGKPVQIRIAFSLAGSWSKLGIECLTVKNQFVPTMNFGWLQPNTSNSECSRVVLHEFGHALGLIHEHKSPAAGIPWKTDAARDYYMQEQGWSAEQVQYQLFGAYSADLSNHTDFDKESIMLYPIPKEIVTDPTYAVGWNQVLSPTDKRFIAQIYPP